VRPSVHVGEPISEVNNDGAGFGVPVIALAMAGAVTAVDTLNLLTKHAIAIWRRQEPLAILYRFLYS
jgi:hypothetical protein